MARLLVKVEPDFRGGLGAGAAQAPCPEGRFHHMTGPFVPDWSGGRSLLAGDSVCPLPGHPQIRLQAGSYRQESPTENAEGAARGPRLRDRTDGQQERAACCLPTALWTRPPTSWAMPLACSLRLPTTLPTTCLVLPATTLPAPRVWLVVLAFMIL